MQRMRKHNDNGCMPDARTRRDSWLPRSPVDMLGNYDIRNTLAGQKANHGCLMWGLELKKKNKHKRQ